MELPNVSSTMTLAELRRHTVQLHAMGPRSVNDPWREMAENAAESLARGSRVIVVGRLEQRTWETPDGDKRSKIEVVADEVGPSLRWATAQVAKNERRGPQGQSAGRGSAAHDVEPF